MLCGPRECLVRFARGVPRSLWYVNLVLTHKGERMRLRAHARHPSRVGSACAR